ncbi:hypothetical protein RRG08_063546 [Elysia crispata]|uniref:Secreted protein n=1 Tax=Elysia crispata TaxID=231223 RepID=A0AAE1D230_9GAST|nr:hypothetical protein RRG08_063546 [Elysia crispata]
MIKWVLLSWVMRCFLPLTPVRVTSTCPVRPFQLIEASGDKRQGQGCRTGHREPLAQEFKYEADCGHLSTQYQYIWKGRKT